MDFISCFPYDDSLTRFSIPGSKIKKIFFHIMRPENRTGEGECYQVNSNIKAVYNNKEKKLVSLSFKGTAIEDDKFYTICLQGYHLKNCKDYLDITEEELRESGKAKVISTSCRDVIEEWLRQNQNVLKKVEGRMVYL